ncbi:MAG TPA: hypothetical protein VHN77_13885 [Phycisphaerales bacterium]|nr:hypothetical protein [Phycisphaerales bacterium]
MSSHPATHATAAVDDITRPLQLDAAPRPATTALKWAFYGLSILVLARLVDTFVLFLIQHTHFLDGARRAASEAMAASYWGGGVPSSFFYATTESPVPFAASLQAPICVSPAQGDLGTSWQAVVAAGTLQDGEFVVRAVCVLFGGLGVFLLTMKSMFATQRAALGLTHPTTLAGGFFTSVLLSLISTVVIGVYSVAQHVWAGTFLNASDAHMRLLWDGGASTQYPLWIELSPSAVRAGTACMYATIGLLLLGGVFVLWNPVLTGIMRKTSPGTTSPGEDVPCLNCGYIHPSAAGCCPECGGDGSSIDAFARLRGTALHSVAKRGRWLIAAGAATLLAAVLMPGIVGTFRGLVHG